MCDKYTGTIISLWTVYETADEYGSRGATVGYFDTRAKADVAARGRGRYYGTPGEVVYGFGLKIGDNEVLPLAVGHPVSLNIDTVRQKTMIREAAKAKLTPEERAILGIID